MEKRIRGVYPAVQLAAVAQVAQHLGGLLQVILQLQLVLQAQVKGQGQGQDAPGVHLPEHFPLGQQGAHLAGDAKGHVGATPGTFGQVAEGVLPVAGVILLNLQGRLAPGSAQGPGLQGDVKGSRSRRVLGEAAQQRLDRVGGLQPLAAQGVAGLIVRNLGDTVAQASPQQEPGPPGAAGSAAVAGAAGGGQGQQFAAPEPATGQGVEGQGPEHQGEAQGKEILPAEGDELVEALAGQGGPHEDEDQAEEQRPQGEGGALGQGSAGAGQGAGQLFGAGGAGGPAAAEEGHEEGGLGLGQVNGGAVGLG